MNLNANDFIVLVAFCYSCFTLYNDFVLGIQVDVFNEHGTGKLLVKA